RRRLGAVGRAGLGRDTARIMPERHLGLTDRRLIGSFPDSFFEGSSMSVTIRLTRAGGKKVPFYRIVAADHRSPRDGRFIEQLGVYDPLRDPVEFRVDEA